MSLAIVETQRLLKLVQGNRSSKTWRFLFNLMLLFLLGYGGVAILISLHITSVMLPLIGLIFFLGSCFVLLVVKTGTFTVEELQLISAHQLETQKEKEIVEAIANLRSEFLNIMSHELRTPLNAIIGFSELINMTTEDPEIQEYNEDILKSGHHLLELIECILKYSSLASGKLKLNIAWFDLRSCIDEVVTKYESIATQNNLEIFYWDLFDHPLQVNGDRPHFQQILEHLLNNAIKFTKEGKISIAATSNSDQFLCMIQDSGIGIQPAYISRLFKAFSLGDSSNTRQHGGIGLGLISCQYLLEAMGGQMWLESNGHSFGSQPNDLQLAMKDELLAAPNALSIMTGVTVFCCLPITIVNF